MEHVKSTKFRPDDDDDEFTFWLIKTIRIKLFSSYFIELWASLEHYILLSVGANVAIKSMSNCLWHHNLISIDNLIKGGKVNVRSKLFA